MRLLLDTHAVLWHLTDDERLGEHARRELSDVDNRVLLSAAVVWEIALKRSLGKLEVTADYLSLLLGAGAEMLPITIDHATAIEQLPWHHRDPFDRMLVVQAQHERASLVSGDPAMRRYGVPVVW